MRGKIILYSITGCGQLKIEESEREMEKKRLKLKCDFHILVVFRFHILPSTLINKVIAQYF